MRIAFLSRFRFFLLCISSPINFFLIPSHSENLFFLRQILSNLAALFHLEQVCLLIFVILKVNFSAKCRKYFINHRQLFDFGSLTLVTQNNTNFTRTCDVAQRSSGKCYDIKFSQNHI